MFEATARHTRFVLDVVEGRQAVNNSQIAQSWARCLNDYRLDPGCRPTAAVAERRTLIECQDALQNLLAIARLEMTNLFRYMAGSRHALLLTNPDGIIVNYLGDPGFNDTAIEMGLQLGGWWDEAHQATNAPGTCLADGAAVIVLPGEHFFSANTRLCGAAAPVLSPQGKLLAAISAITESELAQQHTLVLLKMTAEAIENRYFLSCFKDEVVFRFHGRPEFIGTLGEGLIALSGAGKVLAANSSATFQLGQQAAQSMVGKEISELFNLGMDALLDRTRLPRATPMPAYESRHGHRFYFTVQPPEMAHPVSTSPSPASGRGRRRIDSTYCNSSLESLDSLEMGDETMAYAIRCAKRVLNHSIPILLHGETGTGKELFAKALHHASEANGKPFVAVNCASIPETLIESELFGYKTGAFTGANREGSRGKILQANGGTLFLDEIGDMPLALQSRLLRVLEEREVTPLGGHTPIRVNVRVVSATHRTLPELISEGRFREDLYYRLQGITLTLPPLRERQDKRRLIERILALENEGQVVEIEDRAVETLLHYTWPGNIRQLCNVLRAVSALRDGDVITYESLPIELRNPQSRGAELKTAPPVQEGVDVNPLHDAEREALLQTLETHRWNITRIARRLNVSRNTIYRKMKAHSIQPPCTT